uniref:Opioid growth factor receptor (OGFr) conserved domain-containing protein n=1 Tax=Zooxanthella nutricula TaxID=1333877 RepID=A0A7S2NGY5_9DINO
MKENLNFYLGKQKSKSDCGGEFIDKMHTDWFGNYERLEVDHGYIQWLFPIREPGMNPLSEPLTAHEIDQMKPNPEVRTRLLTSYRLILDFFGMRLVDDATGEIARKEGEAWKPQYRNLQTSRHNYLRITRILKCLGELGLEHFQAPLCSHFMREVFGTGTGSGASGPLSNCAESLALYWIPVIKDDAARASLKAEVEKRLPGVYDPPSKGKGKGKGTP